MEPHHFAVLPVLDRMRTKTMDGHDARTKSANPLPLQVILTRLSGFQILRRECLFQTHPQMPTFADIQNLGAYLWFHGLPTMIDTSGNVPDAAVDSLVLEPSIA